METRTPARPIKLLSVSGMPRFVWLSEGRPVFVADTQGQERLMGPAALCRSPRHVKSRRMRRSWATYRLACSGAGRGLVVWVTFEIRGNLHSASVCDMVWLCELIDFNESRYFSPFVSYVAGKVFVLFKFTGWPCVSPVMTSSFL